MHPCQFRVASNHLAKRVPPINLKASRNVCLLKTKRIATRELLLGCYRLVQVHPLSTVRKCEVDDVTKHSVTSLCVVKCRLAVSSPSATTNEKGLSAKVRNVACFHSRLNCGAPCESHTISIQGENLIHCCFIDSFVALGRANTHKSWRL